MNKEVKEKWIAALRSGNYKQCKGMLRSSDGFCCLGVLCDVLYPEDWRFNSWNWFHNDYLRLLPSKVVKGAGLFGHNVEITDLIWENDEGKTFDEIADTIEKIF